MITRHNIVKESSPTIRLNGKEFIPEAGNVSFKIGDLSISISEDTAAEIKAWVESGHSIITSDFYPMCPECNTNCERDWNFCPYDGTELVEGGPMYSWEVDAAGNPV